MAHPPRYHPDDPYLAQLRGVCLALPGAAEKISHGRPVFFTTKVFAVFGGMLKGDHHSDEFARSVLILPDAGEQPALLADPRFFLPAYLGPGGWVGLNFLADEVDWQEVAELVESSYRNTAPPKLIATLS